MKGDIIPNGEGLFRYVKPESLPKDQTEIPFTIFETENISCDWGRYQLEPEKSYHITEGKNLILKINVCDEIKAPCNPRQTKHKIPELEQKVEHDPIDLGDDKMHPEVINFSHSLISGKKKKLVTTAIARNTTIYKKVDI